MKAMRMAMVLGLVALGALSFGCSGTRGGEGPSAGDPSSAAGGAGAPAGAPAGDPSVQAVPACWTTAVEPKPLSDEVEKGLAWLLKHQQESGGWGQGEESRNMGTTLQALADKPNVGDTCAAALALIRSGSSHDEGPYRDQVRKAVAFVCAAVEAAPEEGLFVTDIKGTRL